MVIIISNYQDHKLFISHALLIITTEPIVIQKKSPGNADVSNIASTMVKMNKITSTTMDHTILVFKLPLNYIKNKFTIFLNDFKIIQFRNFLTQFE